MAGIERAEELIVPVLFLFLSYYQYEFIKNLYFVHCQFFIVRV